MNEQTRIGPYEVTLSESEEDGVWTAWVPELGVRVEADGRYAALSCAAEAIRVKLEPPEIVEIPEPVPIPPPEPESLPVVPPPAPVPEEPKERLFSPLAFVATLAAVAVTAWALGTFGG